LDLGYGYTKAVNDKGNKVQFPTLYKLFENRLNQDLSRFEHIINIDGIEYAVGEFAAISNAVRRWRKTHQLNEADVKVYLGTALYLLNRDSDETEINVNLSVGLPLSHFAGQKEQLESMLKGFTVSANDKNFTINSVMVNQQGVGAFIALLYDVKGAQKEINPDLIVGAALGDIGFRTFDIVGINFDKKNGFYLDESRSATIDGAGIGSVYAATADELNKAYGTSLNALDVEEALNNTNGEKVLARNRIDIKPIVEEKTKELAERISNAILTRFNDLEDLGVVYITGGGAEIITPFINLGNVNVLKQENSQFANVEGYLAKLKLSLAREATVEY
jgi:plasmid segregation protein ParM